MPTSRLYADDPHPPTPPHKGEGSAQVDARPSSLQAAYIRVMDALHRACLVVSGLCLAVIALIIPWGVFTRYVLNSASSWPEPLAVLLMIWLAFLSAVVCYREHLHIGVGIVPGLLTGPAKTVIGWAIEACMLVTNLFMLWWGTLLVQTTWSQAVAEFPQASVGFSYLPVPLGGALTVLFVIERLWTGKLFPPPVEDPLDTISTE